MKSFTYYYEEMRTKWGFGESPPEGIERVRNLILQKVNQALRKTEKYRDVRLCAYDRPGLHNWCMVQYQVGFVPFESSKELEQIAIEALSKLDDSQIVAEKVVIRKL